MPFAPPCRYAGALLLGFLAAAPVPAAAWGSLLLIDAPPRTATLAAGPSVWALPAYPGAKRTEWRLIPGVDYNAPSGFFASTDSGLGRNFSRREDVQAGVRLWPQFGRRPRDLQRGIASIGPRLQIEGFANAQVLPALLLQSGLLYGAGRCRDGAQAEVGMASGLPIGAELLGIGLAATFANRAFRQSYFGVSSVEAAASGTPAWPMPGGRQDMSLTLSAEHRFNREWRLAGQLVAARLLGAAAHSPLIASREQRAATFTLWHDF